MNTMNLHKLKNLIKENIGKWKLNAIWNSFYSKPLKWIHFGRDLEKQLKILKSLYVTQIAWKSELKMEIYTQSVS